jgi:hypothetical protein
MLTKAVLIFAGLFVCAILANVYYALICAVTIFLLRMTDSTALNIQLAVCYALSAVSTFYLLRPGWPKSPNRGAPASTDAQ